MWLCVLVIRTPEVLSLPNKALSAFGAELCLDCQPAVRLGSSRCGYAPIYSNRYQKSQSKVGIQYAELDCEARYHFLGIGPCLVVANIL